MTAPRFILNLIFIGAAVFAMFSLNGCATIESAYNGGKTETLARYATLKIIGNQPDPLAAANQILTFSQEVGGGIDRGDITAAGMIEDAFNKQFDLSALSPADQFIVGELISAVKEAVDKPQVDTVETDAMISLRKFMQAIEDQAKFAVMVYSD